MIDRLQRYLWSLREVFEININVTKVLTTIVTQTITMSV